MGNETSMTPGLNAFGDPSKLNFFNAPEADQQEYQNALRQSLAALEQRYAQPNWFKVAAGFAKPQLGGFMASLGSANEALGENLEQQRAAELPIAQLRAQLALSKIGMGQNKLVADQFQLWKEKGSKPEDLMALRDLAMATAPNAPVTAAIGKRYDSLVTERQLSSADQANVIGRINTAKALGRPVDPADIAKLAQYSKTLDYAPNRLEEKPEPFKPVTDTGVNADYSFASKLGNANLQSAIDSANNVPNGENGVISTPVQKTIIESSPIKKPSSIKSAPKNQNELSTSDQNLINQLLGAPNTKSAVAGKNPQLQPDQDQKTSNEKYPILHPYPDTTDMSDERAGREVEKAKMLAQKQEAISDDYVKSLAPYGNPTLFEPLKQSYKKVEKLLTKNPVAANETHNILGTGNFLSQITNSIQEGGVVNIGSGILNGTFSLSLPATTWQNAGLPEKYADYANEITTEYIKVQLLKARMNGANINNIPVAEFNTMLNANPNIKMRASASLGQIREGKYDLLYQNMIHNQIQDEFNNKIEKNELAPNTSIIKHSQKLKLIKKAWDTQKNELAEKALKRSQ
jgi:hypothetical protein